MSIHVSRSGVGLLGTSLTLDEVNRRLRAGTLRPSDSAWTAGMTSWQPLETIPGVITPPAANNLPDAVKRDESGHETRSNAIPPPVPQNDTAETGIPTKSPSRLDKIRARAVILFVVAILDLILAAFVSAIGLVIAVSAVFAAYMVRRKANPTERGLLAGTLVIGCISMFLSLLFLLGMPGPSTVSKNENVTSTSANATPASETFSLGWFGPKATIENGVAHLKFIYDQPKEYHRNDAENVRNLVDYSLGKAPLVTHADDAEPSYEIAGHSEELCRIVYKIVRVAPASGGLILSCQMLRLF